MHEKIAFVDNYLPLVDSTVELLGEEGYEAIGINPEEVDSDELIRRIKAREIEVDLVITGVRNVSDGDNNDRSGLRLAERLHEIGIPVIVFSADPNKQTVAEEMGVYFVSKGGSIDPLLQTIGRVFTSEQE